MVYSLDICAHNHTLLIFFVIFQNYITLILSFYLTWTIYFCFLCVCLYIVENKIIKKSLFSSETVWRLIYICLYMQVFFSRVSWTPGQTRHLTCASLYMSLGLPLLLAIKTTDPSHLPNSRHHWSNWSTNREPHITKSMTNKWQP